MKRMTFTALTVLTVFLLLYTLDEVLGFDLKSLWVPVAAGVILLIAIFVEAKARRKADKRP